MIKVYWADEEKTIIQLDYSHPVASWDEYQAAVDESHDLARSVDYPVIILHNPDETPMPSGNPIEQLRMAMFKAPKNIRVFMMVINNRIARRMVDAVIYIMNFGKNYKIVESVDAAKVYIASLECDAAS